MTDLTYITDLGGFERLVGVGPLTLVVKSWLQAGVGSREEITSTHVGSVVSIDEVRRTPAAASAATASEVNVWMRDRAQPARIRLTDDDGQPITTEIGYRVHPVFI
ncbi:hypothetical protein ACF1AJ_19240 [Leifsonia sp. NPDC014704]|uniref:Uncharacterized protein n=1 Tax=Leifsonia virtsii TaxID=3035915 RepID=A0ABT8J2U0_9MICO|nr:hypothetical protein [Leifsonia virtsii]MDN4599394.1 hypothetical protein [Leifsonia virtsii]